MQRDDGEKKEKKNVKIQTRPWVDQVGFNWRMTCQMMKRIDTFGLVDSLGIYVGDITLMSVLKDLAEKRRREKEEKMGW